MIIIYEGKKSRKMVNGMLQDVTPVVATDGKGPYSSFGVGVIVHELGVSYFWGLVFPRNLIQAWRAVKVLEIVELIESDTLCACWYTADTTLRDSDTHYLETISQIVGHDNVSVFRTALLNVGPDNNELTKMLTVVARHNLLVDGKELAFEVLRDRIAPSPIVSHHIEIDRARTDRYRKINRIRQSTMPPEKSLAQFFADYGIKNITNGVYGPGLYTLRISEIDLFAKEQSLLEPKSRGFHTLCSEYVLRPVERNAYGHPCVQGKDGVQYHIIFAKYVEDQDRFDLYVSKKPIKPFAPFTENLPDLERIPLSELRERTVKPSLTKRILARLGLS